LPGSTAFCGELNARRSAPTLAALLRAHDVNLPFPENSLPHDDLGEERQEFADTLRKWWPYVPPKFRPLVPAWVEVIEHAMAVPLSRKSIKILRGMMRNDVKQQAEELRKADRKVMAEWVAFNPKWVGRLIAERAALDPMLLLPPTELAAAKQVHVTKSDTKRKRASRSRELSQKLLGHLHSHGGAIEWCPVELSHALSSKGGGPRLKPEKISDAASALVCIDVARWIKDRDGNKYQLQLVDARLMLPSPETFH
jgi:hypothetical protein